MASVKRRCPAIYMENGQVKIGFMKYPGPLASMQNEDTLIMNVGRFKTHQIEVNKAHVGILANGHDTTRPFFVNACMHLFHKSLVESVKQEKEKLKSSEKENARLQNEVTVLNEKLRKMRGKDAEEVKEEVFSYLDKMNKLKAETSGKATS